MSTQINPYLTFNGSCREAMTFYKSCFGGELSMQAIKDSPMAEQMPAAAQDQILHAQLKKGDLTLMGSDMAHEQYVKGNSISLSVNCSTEEEIRSFFASLSAGGTVRDPLRDMFWGAIFGAITDKFGINWIFNYDKAEK